VCRVRKFDAVVGGAKTASARRRSAESSVEIFASAKSRTSSSKLKLHSTTQPHTFEREHNSKWHSHPEADAAAVAAVVGAVEDLVIVVVEEEDEVAVVVALLEVAVLLEVVVAAHRAVEEEEAVPEVVPKAERKYSMVDLDYSSSLPDPSL